MKAKELIDALSLYPEDTEIYMSRDDEGNGYMPVYELATTRGIVCIWPGWPHYDDLSEIDGYVPEEEDYY
jgi:hypothetical protein